MPLRARFFLAAKGTELMIASCVSAFGKSVVVMVSCADLWQGGWRLGNWTPFSALVGLRGA